MQLFSQLNTKDIVGYLIILDIDGTLINDNEYKLDDKTLNKINDLKQNNQIYLCSNSHNHKRNKKVASLANIEYIDTNLKKPGNLHRYY